jgi:hypothetical protein
MNKERKGYTYTFLVLLVGNKVWGDVTFVELQAFHNFKLVI